MFKHAAKQKGGGAPAAIVSLVLLCLGGLVLSSCSSRERDYIVVTREITAYVRETEIVTTTPTPLIDAVAAVPQLVNPPDDWDIAGILYEAYGTNDGQGTILAWKIHKSGGAPDAFFLVATVQYRHGWLLTYLVSGGETWRERVLTDTDAYGSQELPFAPSHHDLVRFLDNIAWSYSAPYAYWRSGFYDSGMDINAWQMLTGELPPDRYLAEVYLDYTETPYR